MYYKNTQSGFSLIEMMVSLAIFGIVLVTATAAVLRVVDANRKTQALKSVVNNINFVLERMSREVRTGSMYHCDTSGNIGEPVSCPTTGSAKGIAFEASGGDPNTVSDQIVYECKTAEYQGVSNGFIQRSDKGGVSPSILTSPGIDIKRCRFFVAGAGTGDNMAPAVFISLYGVAGIGERDMTEFVIQTSLTQRVLEGN